MDLEKIESLIRLMRANGLHELKLKEGNESICLTQSASGSAPMPYMMPTLAPQMQAPMPSSAPRLSSQASAEDAHPSKAPQSQEKFIEVRSPFVGTYYAAPSPGADNFIALNKTVRKGDTLCIVEAMKLMNEIEAERDGVIVKILVENEQAVEYDQVLFLMK